MSPLPTFEFRVAEDGFGRFHVEVFIGWNDPRVIPPGPFFIGRTAVHSNTWTTLRTTGSRGRAFRLVEKYRAAALRADLDAANRTLRVVVSP